jgi:hypothetical protein
MVSRGESSPGMNGLPEDIIRTALFPAAGKSSRITDAVIPVIYIQKNLTIFKKNGTYLYI